MQNCHMNLENKHILITGASSGIGRATAILAAELGAKITLLARRESELQATLDKMPGKGHYCCRFDLSQLSDIEATVKTIIDAMGPLDGLVHCAGMAQNRPLAMTKPDFVCDIMTVNFNALLELIRSVAKKTRINDGASIVGISSVASLKGDKSQGAYAASKAAVNGLIPPLAKELAPRKIRINAVAFGMMQTEMYKIFKDAGGGEDALKNQYLGLGEPEDAAKVLCFLLSDYAKLITGTIIAADAGYLS